MDFSSFNLEGDGNLFKQNYQVENSQDGDFFNFMDDTSNFENGTFTTTPISPEKSSFSNNSTLSAHNTEYTMSPIASQVMHPTYHTPLQHPMQTHLEDFADEEV